MPELNRYVNRTGYDVTNVFADSSRIKKATYQVGLRADGSLESHGMRSGDEIPPKLFFSLESRETFHTPSAKRGRIAMPEMQKRYIPSLSRLSVRLGGLF